MLGEQTGLREVGMEAGDNHEAHLCIGLRGRPEKTWVYIVSPGDGSRDDEDFLTERCRVTCRFV